MHLNVRVIGCEFLRLAVAHQIHAAIADVSDTDFFIAKNACRERCAHAALLGFEAEVIDVEVGFSENLVEDLIGFAARRRGLERIHGDVDRHPAGDFAGTQSADSISDG